MVIKKLKISKTIRIKIKLILPNLATVSVSGKEVLSVLNGFNILSTVNLRKLPCKMFYTSSMWRFIISSKYLIEKKLSEVAWTKHVRDVSNALTKCCAAHQHELMAKWYPLLTILWLHYEIPKWLYYLDYIVRLS